MIKFTYETDEGTVTAEFDSVESLENFRAELRERAKKREEDAKKAESEARAARDAARKEAEERRNKERKEIKSGIKSAFEKAKESGFSPDETAVMIRESLIELIEDLDTDQED